MCHDYIVASISATNSYEGQYPLRMEIQIAYAFIGSILTRRGGSIILEMK